MSQKYGDIKQHLELAGMEKYLKATSVITWNMVLQRPPMVLKTDGVGRPWKGDKVQEIFGKSADPSNPKAKVEYYLHPELYHGSSLMVKGRVCLSIK